MGGLNRMDINGQGAGWTKCSGLLHRRVRWLIGFSTTWVGCGRRIGSGRAVGVRGGTLRGPGGWRRRRLAGGTSGWRGMCRRSRLGIGAPPKKLILRRFGMWSGGVGRGRTRGGRLTGSRRVGGAPGPRSRASSSCRTRARATWRCGWRSGMRSGRGCRGRCDGRAGDRLARYPLPALRRALADGLRQGRAEGREPRDTLLQVRGDARDADRHGAAGAGKGVRMKSRKRRYHRRERRKAKASRWRRLPKSNPKKVGHGPN